MPSVSCARSGSTSIETRPSAAVSSATDASTSQASRTSSVVSSKITRSASAPSPTSLRTWASYRSPSAIAAAKIVGFVVTPTTKLSRTRSARLPVSIRSRGQVVEPDRDAGVGEGLQSVTHGCSLPGGETVAGGGGHRGRGDAVLLVDPGVVGGRAVRLDRDDPAVVADDLPPALGDAGLDRDPGLDDRRDHGVAVRLLLVVEPLPARHRHHAGPDAVLGQDRARLDGELDLRPGPDEYDVGQAALACRASSST